jgi:polysaccharide export outer membrane protein
MRPPSRPPTPSPRRSNVRRLLATLVVAGGPLAGCDLDSFMNPSVTGYWQHTPTTIPILERIDVIEQDGDYWGQTTSPTPEDLLPSDLLYEVVPGDFITVSIYELYTPGAWTSTTRRVAPSGYLRVQELGDIPAAGKSPQEIQDIIEEILRQGYLTRPQVDVVVEEGGAFTYTMYGSVGAPGLFTLRKPDFRLLDAIAVSGGTSPLIKDIYVVRQVELTDEVMPEFERDRGAPEPGTPEAPGGTEPIDIEQLIEQIERPSRDSGVSPGAIRSQDDPIDVDELLPPAPRSQDDPVVDIDQLEPARPPGPPQVDIDDVARPPDAGTTGTWVYVEERGEWVRMPGRAAAIAGTQVPPVAERPLFVERVIRISNSRLLQGDSKHNIVVRPKDRIYVEPPPQGVVYIDGQIVRPGTFNLPPSGITLSRLVAAAGGLGQLAIPERVDLVRKIGPAREAAVRVNLGAIRKRTEPDILLKPDDHVIIGTNFIATPLAIIRNGFRATYGFGFLLDRNFGNDVFGAPPTNFR